MEGSPVKEGGIDGETMNATAAAKEGGLEQGPTNQEPARFFCKIGKYDNKDLFRFVIMGGRGYEFHGKAPANFEQTPEGFAIFGDIMYSPVVDKDEFVLELNKAEGEDGACNAG